MDEKQTTMDMVFILFIGIAIACAKFITNAIFNLIITTIAFTSASPVVSASANFFLFFRFIVIAPAITSTIGKLIIATYVPKGRKLTAFFIRALSAIVEWRTKQKAFGRFVIFKFTTTSSKLNNFVGRKFSTVFEPGLSAVAKGISNLIYFVGEKFLGFGGCALIAIAGGRKNLCAIGGRALSAMFESRPKIKTIGGNELSAMSSGRNKLNAFGRFALFVNNNTSSKLKFIVWEIITSIGVYASIAKGNTSAKLNGFVRVGFQVIGVCALLAIVRSRNKLNAFGKFVLFEITNTSAKLNGFVRVGFQVIGVGALLAMVRSRNKLNSFGGFVLNALTIGRNKLTGLGGWILLTIANSNVVTKVNVFTKAMLGMRAVGVAVVLWAFLPNAYGLDKPSNYYKILISTPNVVQKNSRDFSKNS